MPTGSTPSASIGRDHAAPGGERTGRRLDRSRLGRSGDRARPLDRPDLARRLDRRQCDSDRGQLAHSRRRQSDVRPAQATGTATLTSSAGAFVATGPVTGVALTLTGNGGITAGTVTSGGTTLLQSPNGAVTHRRPDLGGAVTARGRSLDLDLAGQRWPSPSARGDRGRPAVQVNAQDDLNARQRRRDRLRSSSLSAGGNVVSGNLSAGTWTYVEAAGSATLGDFVAGTDADGEHVRRQSHGRQCHRRRRNLAEHFRHRSATRVLTTGNLVSTGLGSDARGGPAGAVRRLSGRRRARRATSPACAARARWRSAMSRRPGRAILVADLAHRRRDRHRARRSHPARPRQHRARRGDHGGQVLCRRQHDVLPPCPTPTIRPRSTALAPVDTSGSLTVTGAVNAGTVSIAVGTDLTIASLTSGGTTLLRATGGPGRCRQPAFGRRR